MRWYHVVSYFFGGASLANTIPHLVAGISGSPFQSPLPPRRGEGLSSALVNVLWGLLKKLREYREPASFGTATVATAADNRTAAVVTSKGKLIRFDLTTGAATPVTTGIDSAAAGPVFSPAGKLLAVPGQASFGQPAPVAVIDRATGKTQHTFRCPDGGPVCAAFSPDGRYLVTGTNQTTALGWELTR